jgi:hypothetical protein
VDWHARNGRGLEPVRLKAVVPNLIASYAGHHDLSCFAYPPVVYVGHAHAVMVHFAFELHSVPNAFRGHAAQSERQLLSLPMIEAADGRLRFAANQPPGVTPASCASQLDFLGNIERDALLDQAARAGVGEGSSAPLGTDAREELAISRGLARPVARRS